MILFMLFQGWRSKVNTDNLVSNITKYSDTASFYKLKSGALISTNKSLILSSQKQINDLAASMSDTVKLMLKKFKSVQAVTQVTNNFYASGDTIKSSGNIPCDFDPYVIVKRDDNYTLKETIAKKYISVDSLFIPNKITTVFGRKKSGFLKADYSVDVNNSNELMKATNIADYRYIPQKMWYERTWVHMLAGALIQTAIVEGAPILINKIK